MEEEREEDAQRMKADGNGVEMQTRMDGLLLRRKGTLGTMIYMSKY